MQERAMENKFRLANSELNERMALLEESLLRNEKTVEELRESEKRYRRLFESAKDGILILDEETGRVVDVNPFLLHLLGYSYAELCGQFIWELGVFKDIAASKDAFMILQEHEYIRYDDLPLETHDGHAISVEFVSNVYLVDNTKVIQCNIRDITARKRADAEHNRLMAAIIQTGEAIVMTDEQGTIQFVNPAFERTTGYARDEVLGQNPRILKSDKQDEQFYAAMWMTISSGKSWAGRMVNKRKDGTLYTEDTTISPVKDAAGKIVNYVAVKRDITEDLRLAMQLQQAQKMEAVGLLAGGVAHDFNNMLSVIIGYTEIALKKTDTDERLHDDLGHIHKAALRSTEITRQLLAFARKQTIMPVALDLNQSVESMLKMVRRLIGEDIELVWKPGSGLRNVMMDPVQIDQLLANLCVNARDAISDVGTIRIETANAVFDEAYCLQHAGYAAGEYVLLSVTDDGCGMDKAVLDQIFEPFFTSKELGQGTGLGLSTVYGIVKQNNGFINVYSEPGKGTTFRIYLPRTLHDMQVRDDLAVGQILQSRGETLLLVEDEPSLLVMARMMLQELGYVVYAAGTPHEALALAVGHAKEIQLIVTDVVMPEMNGRDMSDRVSAMIPGVKVLFMSGYPADVIVHRGVLDKGMNFIQKPFSQRDLAAKLRDTLKEE